MLAFARAAKGRLVASHVDHGDSQFMAYATRPGRGRLTLTPINKDSRSKAVQVTIAGNSGVNRGSVLRLAGPAGDAKAGISFGGTEGRPRGTWKPGKDEVVSRKHGILSVALPPWQAAVVELL